MTAQAIQAFFQDRPDTSDISISPEMAAALSQAIWFSELRYLQKSEVEGLVQLLAQSQTDRWQFVLQQWRAQKYPSRREKPARVEVKPKPLSVWLQLRQLFQGLRLASTPTT